MARITLRNGAVPPGHRKHYTFGNEACVVYVYPDRSIVLWKAWGETVRYTGDDVKKGWKNARDYAARRRQQRV